MKQALLIVLLCCLTNFMAWSQNEPWKDAKGSGQLHDPWRIETGEHLTALAESVNKGNSYYGTYFAIVKALTWGESNAPIVNPIGSDLSCPFQGYLDGCGNLVTLSISVPFINGYAFSGLFGYLGEGAVVTNLSLSGSISVTANGKAPKGDNKEYQGDKMFLGSIAAFVGTGATVRNCEVDIAVTCNANGRFRVYLGRLVGCNLGLVENCVDRTRTPFVFQSSMVSDLDGHYIGMAIGFNGSEGQFLDTP